MNTKSSTSNIGHENETNNQKIFKNEYARNYPQDKMGRAVAEATMYECDNLAPRRCILGPSVSTRQLSSQITKVINKSNEFTFGIMGGGIDQWVRTALPPISMPTPRQKHRLKDMCICKIVTASSLNPRYLAHSSRCKTLLHQVAW